MHLIRCVYWTDGHGFNPFMSKQVSGLMRRPSDGYLFWESDAMNLGCTDAKQKFMIWDETTPDPIECVWPAEWKSLEFVEKATEEDCFRALASDLTASRERELFVREKLYRIFNHPVRYGEHRVDNKRHQDNTQALLSMLRTDDPHEGMMKAEVLRNDRKIDEAIDILQSLKFPENFYLEDRVGKIRELAERGIPAVAIYSGKMREPEPAWEFSKKLPRL